MTMQSRMGPRGIRAIGGVAALCLAAGWRSAAAQDTVRAFQTTVLSIDTMRIVLSAPTPTGTRQVRLPSPLLRRLAPLRGRSFTALAEERPTPAGLRAAVVLRDETGVRAVAEHVRDVQLLRPVDRGGIQVELQPAESRTLLYEDQCQIVYNVPTAFTIGGEQVMLLPHETRRVSVGGDSYTIELTASQLIVPKPCPAVFEGSRSLIEYVILRSP